MFIGIHVRDMSIPNIQFNMTNESDLPKVPLMFGTSKGNILLELMQVSKSLQEVIVASTTCKNVGDDLIKMMVPKDDGASTSQANDQENVRTINVMTMRIRLVQLKLALVPVLLIILKIKNLFD